MSDAVKQIKEGSVLILEVNNPPVNALGHAVRQGLWDGIEQAEADDEVHSVLIIGAGRTFPAGADISEFGTEMKEPHLPKVINKIEDCSKPVVAALHGTALGGGFEIALGAHYRIATEDAKIGLPEVHLGLLPGAGGTQRMPRIAGAELSLDVMLKGTPIPAAKAQKAGLIDKLTAVNLREEAVAYAASVTEPRKSREETKGLQDAASFKAAIGQTRSMLAKRARGQMAPFKIVDCVEAALEKPFWEGLEFERNSFFECYVSDQSKGMIHAFFADRAAVKVPEAKRAEPRKLETLGVIGGGTMGAGITVAALDAGLPVVMIERDAESLKRGQSNVGKVYDRLIAKGRMDEAKKANIMGRFTTSTNFEELSKVDMVIEAVFERLDVKQEVFRKLDAVAKADAVLASNTSYIDIDKISGVTNRPDQVLGLHFFSPANIMKLLEIVVPSQAADDVVATGFALAKRLKKTPVRAGNADGFIGNRILAKYGLCAAHMMEDGASPYDIDQAILDFGYPMGIHAVYDLAGLDIGWDNRKAAAPDRDPADRYVSIADRICENGWFGQKTGRGFYRYPDGARSGEPDPDVLQIIADERAAKGITPRDFTVEEIMRRYMAAMVLEGCKVLEEGVALKPSDIDVTLIYGYGFPRYRGGPMKYADMYGLDHMLDDIREFAKEDPRFWAAPKLLIDLVKSGKNFDSLNLKG